MKNFNSLRSRPRDRRQMYSKEMNVVKLIVCCFGEGRAGCGKVLALEKGDGNVTAFLTPNLQCENSK